MAKFKIDSEYKPSGDQPAAIKGICEALNQGVDAVTLLGVTGSGKTFTMANVIEKLQRPALILSHNKTLAAQLYGEFKSFFPNNAVEYFVSYYDYYQPEAYLPVTDTYIEKDLSINDEIEKLRLSAASSLLSGRRDVIVISSVSCLYGIGNPADFVVTKLPAGYMAISSSSSMNAPVIGSITDIASTSSPKNSMRTAFSPYPIHTSTVSPRTRKVPLLKSVSVRLYRASTS